MQSCKAMRQMLGRPRRVGVAYGEAGRDPISDEAGGTLHEHPDTGMEGFKAGHRWLTEDLPMNLKRSNRPVRTRMPGGVAGVPPTGGPLCRFSAQAHVGVFDRRPTNHRHLVGRYS